ncbi:MAG: aromatic ring-hydroxylating dioxygenase subunit alpha, partial [Ottowia sp.]|nr:aromatic ring-hydroxylating dioxygenase subunit alpha [Ottowia sp.]
MTERFKTIFTTLGDSPRPLPEIAEFDEPDRRVIACGCVGVHTSPYRIIENFLDMAHFSFVHTDILGAADKTEVFAYKSEHRKDVDEVWATDCTFFQPAASKSAAKEGGGQITQYKYRVMSPFSVMLYKNVFGDETRDDAIVVFVQPKTETDCNAYMTMALVDATSS